MFRKILSAKKQPYFSGLNVLNYLKSTNQECKYRQLSLENTEIIVDKIIFLAMVMKTYSHHDANLAVTGNTTVLPEMTKLASWQLSVFSVLA